ncbi:MULTISPECIES: SA1362 family protein [unclassified Virgibacillus]|uniref:SA1362 family protein n=1 Tax=unclassified Virgibacillus TaxID=2620237 RepID=UPI0024DE1C66|nr:SA1362 family protein [Virgibacillus sp. LDC-1]
MSGRKLSVIVYVLIGFAAIGLMSQLFSNTTGFLFSLLKSIFIGLLIFGLIYFLFLKNRVSSSDAKKYKQAVKQSKQKYKQKKPSSKAKTIQQQPIKPQAKKKNTRQTSHLRVIDGNKTKRKKRASN